MSRWSHNPTTVNFTNPQTSCLRFYRWSFQCTYARSVSSVVLFQSPPCEPDYTCCSLWTHQPPRDMANCNLCNGLLPPLFTLIRGWSSPSEVSVSGWWMTRCSGLLSWPHFQKPRVCTGVAEDPRWQWRISIRPVFQKTSAFSTEHNVQKPLNYIYPFMQCKMGQKLYVRQLVAGMFALCVYMWTICCRPDI